MKSARLGRAQALALALILLALAQPGQAERRYCGAIQDRAIPNGANASTGHTGRYFNSRYGYALTIPAALTTVDNADAPERGVTVWLSRVPRAFIYVDALYDALYDITAQAVQQRDLDRLSVQVRIMRPATRSRFRLAGHEGRRYVVPVQCANDPTVYIEDDVVVVRNREIYRAHLHSNEAQYAKNEATFLAMLASWRWVRIHQ